MESTTITQAKRKILEHLKRHGPVAATQLAQALKLTDVAIRQHLAALEKQRWVKPTPLPPQGRGRPAAAWALTEAAASLFPDRHAELSVELIEALRGTVGEQALLRSLQARVRHQLGRYRNTVLPQHSLAHRVRQLAAARTAEGYMAEAVQENPDSHLLIEHHCPICSAARSCRALCETELDVFRKTLGEDTQVERIEHVLAKGSRCAYRVTSR